MAPVGKVTQGFIDQAEKFGAHNYAPLPVVISSGEGVWLTDVEGRRYLDMLSAYSAVNFGHSNPRILAAAERQLRKLTLTSRAFYNDQFGLLCEELSALCGLDSVLLMNSGAEAVETAIKMARRWGYEKKRVAQDRAEIITFRNNFHGRTTTITSFASGTESRRGYGPFTPGFVTAPYGDLECLEAHITDNTVAVLIEPIQGEGGIIIPPAGYLRGVRTLCDRHRVLMLADEIQTGLCRTGKLFACDHEGVRPDAYILGKSLGGGIVPISAVVATDEAMSVFSPGSHGSTFGGNPFACAIAREVLALIRETKPEQIAAAHGAWFVEQLRTLGRPVTAVRARGLLIGMDIDPAAGKAKDFCKRLLQQGVLAKDTREQTIRFAPPLTISKEELTWGWERVRAIFS